MKKFLLVRCYYYYYLTLHHPAARQFCRSTYTITYYSYIRSWGTSCERFQALYPRETPDVPWAPKKGNNNHQK
jgi:hypothetical protein